MRPDRPGDDRTGRGRQEASWARLRPSDSSPSSLVPFEPLDTTGLSVLEEELAAAGRRIRAERSRAEWPDPLFAASLRDRLIGQLPFAERTTPAPRAERTVPAMDPPAFAPERLMPRLVRATPRFLPAPGWTIATIAAALVVSLVGLGPGHLLQAPAPSRAGDVAGASLVRGGSTTALAAGAALEVGDEIRTTDIGRATLQLGNSQARLSGGSDMVIRSLAADGLVLEQLAGRAYHRVAVASGGTYTVMTAAVSWTAHGTAFDLDRRTLASGAERLTLLTIEHSVSVAGPDVSATVTEGRRAELVLGLQGVAPDIATGPIRPGELSDGWLAANAALDRTAGFSTGILTGLAPTEPPSSPQPTEPNVPSPPPGPAATAPADPSPKPAPKPTPVPTVRPTATPRAATPEPTPRPTPTPIPIAPLALSAGACPGGTILDWSAAPAGGFHHYKTLWSGSDSFSDASVVSGTYTTDRYKTSAADLNATGTRWYRTYAYDSLGHVVAKSSTRSATGLGDPDGLGALSVTDGTGTTDFAWPTFGGSADCFTWYKVVYSADDSSPSYLTAATLATYTSDQSAGTASAEIPPGTYWFRMQVLRETDMGKFIVAQTDPQQHVVP